MTSGARPVRLTMAALAAGAVVAAGSACSAATSGAAGVGAPNGGPVREAVVRIGPFADVRAVAVSPTRAFVVADGGLAMYDRGRHRWLPPITLGFGGSLAARGEPCAAVTNLIGDAVWIACGTRVTVVRPSIGAVWATELGAPVTALSVDRSGADAFAFIAGSIAVVSASGTARALSAGETVAPDRIAARVAVGGNQQLFQAVSDPLLLRDATLRVWRPSAVARAEGAGELWVGTHGGGVFVADVDFHRSHQLPFGLQSGMVRAVARTADGVIVAEDPPNGSANRSLITSAGDDLATWAWPSLYNAMGALRGVVAREETLCVGGELGAGLARQRPGPESDGAPFDNDHRVYDPVNVVIATRLGCAVGTDRAVVILPWSSTGEAAAAGAAALGSLPPVRALAASGDTVWAGTVGGLHRCVGSPCAPALLRLPASISPAIVALALTPDGLALASAGELWLGSGADRTATFARPIASTARLGRLTTLASDATTLWVGGTNGLMAIALSSGSTVDVPLDDPGAMAAPVFGSREVRSIALAPGVAWVGTAAGLVRVRRGDDGLPR